MSQEELKATSKSLEETSTNLTQTQGWLQETKQELVQTRVERDERGFLVEHHHRNEQALLGEATEVRMLSGSGVWC